MITLFEEFARKHDRQYGFAEGRTVGISKEAFVDALEGIDYDWRDNPPALFRGVNKNFDYAKMTKDSGRVSRNTHNYYTVWMDNHPDWAGWPKRSESFVCTTSTHKSDNYGTSYAVLPLIGKHDMIAVCPAQDIWLALESDRIKHKKTREYLHFLGSGYDSYPRFKARYNPDNHGDDFDFVELGDNMKALGVPETYDGLMSWIRNTDKEYGTRLEDAFRTMINPDKFELMTYEELAHIKSETYKGREVWFSADAIAVKNMVLITNAVNNDISTSVKYTDLGLVCP